MFAGRLAKPLAGAVGRAGRFSAVTSRGSPTADHGEMAENLRGETGRPEATRNVTRGVRRLLRASGCVVLTEVPLPSGRRADIVALSGDGILRIVEIKSSNEDFRADRKWSEYRAHCDRFYFAIPLELPAGGFPLDAGLILADAYGAMLEREAPLRKIPPASRRAMLLRFATLAAERLNWAVYGDE